MVQCAMCNGARQSLRTWISQEEAPPGPHPAQTSPSKPTPSTLLGPIPHSLAVSKDGHPQRQVAQLGKGAAAHPL